VTGSCEYGDEPSSSTSTDLVTHCLTLRSHTSNPFPNNTVWLLCRSQSLAMLIFHVFLLLLPCMAQIASLADFTVREKVSRPYKTNFKILALNILN
jgi:hypothetical protein